MARTAPGFAATFKGKGDLQTTPDGSRLARAVAFLRAFPTNTLNSSGAAADNGPVLRPKKMSTGAFIAITAAALVVGIGAFILLSGGNDGAETSSLEQSKARASVLAACKASPAMGVDCNCLVTKLDGLGYKTDADWSRLTVVFARGGQGAAQDGANIGTATAACRTPVPAAPAQ